MMKKLIIFCCLLVLAGASWAENKGVEFIKERIGPRGEIRGVEKDPVTNFTVVKIMIRQGQRLFPVAAYVTPDGKYAIFGSIYDISTGRDLTREVHLKDMTIETTKINPSPWMKGPFLGKGKEKMLIVAGPRCPHCRELIPKVVKEAKDNDKVSIAYVTFSPFSPPETEKAIECVRQKKPELFWETVVQAYTEDPSALPSWLKKKGFNVAKECNDIEGRKELPPVDGVPSGILENGTVLEGGGEIMEYLTSK